MISVVIITYDGELFLREQLDSIYNQTILPDEVIVSDDCSKDGTIDILKEFKARYGLKYYVNANNLGYLGNLKESLFRCDGDYVFFADQDDIWFPDRIERALKKMLDIEEPGVPAIVSCKFVDVDANGKVLRKHYKYLDSDDYAIHLFGSVTMASASMINKALLHLYRKMDEPKDFMMGIIASMTGKIFRIGSPLYYYRRHDFNTMNKATSLLLKREKFKWVFIDKYSVFYDLNIAKNLLDIDCVLSQYFLPDRLPLFKKIRSCLDEKILFNKIKILISIKEMSILDKILVSVILIRRM